eukprot:COSAG04_NODE_15738_length_522_cov_0.940898_1_plen_148_part_10
MGSTRAAHPSIPELKLTVLCPGFLVVRGCMSAEHSELVKDDIDAQMKRRAAEGDTRNSSPWIAETEHLGGLTVFPPIVERVAQLMAASEQGKSTFSFHHQHANRFDTGAGSADWHQVRFRCAATGSCVSLSLLVSVRCAFMTTSSTPI